MLGRGGESLEQEQVAGQERMGYFEDTRQCWGKICPLPERRKLQLNRTRLMKGRQSAGGCHIHGAAAALVMSPREQQNQGRSGGFPPLRGNGSQLGYLSAGVCRMNPPMSHHKTWGHGNSFGGEEAEAAHAASP